MATILKRFYEIVNQRIMFLSIFLHPELITKYFRIFYENCIKFKISVYLNDSEEKSIPECLYFAVFLLIFIFSLLYTHI
jgi:hypothetical protein